MSIGILPFVMVVDGAGAEIRRTESKLARLRFDVRFRQSQFWIAWFDYMCDSVSGWTDDAQAESLMRQGRAQLLREDIDGLRGTVMKLRELAPPDATARVERFQNVGIRRS